MSIVLCDLLATGAQDAPAICASGRSPLGFGALRSLIAQPINRLNALGTGRNDRVAIVLPNGPEMATCSIACASGVTSAPLNPAYRADEFEFYRSDLHASAPIVERGSPSAAVDMAQKMGVRVIDLIANSDRGAGYFDLQPRASDAVTRPTKRTGYENNPKANEEAFENRWFGTGDQGVMDDEGYISITERLKEIINRGGEKVSPREVDEILMDHAAVAQVGCFGMPHPKLGEEVAAVVVLREGQQVTECELQAFVSSRAADYKVPKKIFFMDEIPKGATGKLNRIGLAAKLGLT